MKNIFLNKEGKKKNKPPQKLGLTFKTCTFKILDQAQYKNSDLNQFNIEELNRKNFKNFKKLSKYKKKTIKKQRSNLNRKKIKENEIINNINLKNYFKQNKQ